MRNSDNISKIVREIKRSQRELEKLDYVFKQYTNGVGFGDEIRKEFGLKR